MPIHSAHTDNMPIIIAPCSVVPSPSPSPLPLPLPLPSSGPPPHHASSCPSFLFFFLYLSFSVILINDSAAQVGDCSRPDLHGPFLTTTFYPTTAWTRYLDFVIHRSPEKHARSMLVQCSKVLRQLCISAIRACSYLLSSTTSALVARHWQSSGGRLIPDSSLRDLLHYDRTPRHIRRSVCLHRLFAFWVQQAAETIPAPCRLAKVLATLSNSIQRLEASRERVPLRCAVRTSHTTPQFIYSTWQIVGLR